MGGRFSTLLYYISLLSRFGVLLGDNKSIYYSKYRNPNDNTQRSSSWAIEGRVSYIYQLQTSITFVQPCICKSSKKQSVCSMFLNIFSTPRSLSPVSIMASRGKIYGIVAFYLIKHPFCFHSSLIPIFAPPIQEPQNRTEILISELITSWKRSIRLRSSTRVRQRRGSHQLLKKQKPLQVCKHESLKAKRNMKKRLMKTSIHKKRSKVHWIN